MQHAIRLLSILHQCSEEVAAGDPDGCVGVIRAELRLQALDFWLRNPDYLAGELLNPIDAGVLAARPYLNAAAEMLHDPEPDLHWYPMPRWHHGAYEAVDDAFSVLSAYGLALVRRLGGVTKPARSQFFLTEAGARTAATLSDEPVLAWYPKQAQIVALVAGDDNGSTLKKRQYEQAEYARTKLGATIAPIQLIVQARLEEITSRGTGSGAS